MIKPKSANFYFYGNWDPHQLRPIILSKVVKFAWGDFKVVNSYSFYQIFDCLVIVLRQQKKPNFELADPRRLSDKSWLNRGFSCRWNLFLLIPHSFHFQIYGLSDLWHIQKVCFVRLIWSTSVEWQLLIMLWTAYWTFISSGVKYEMQVSTMYQVMLNLAQLIKFW